MQMRMTISFCSHRILWNFIYGKDIKHFIDPEVAKQNYHELDIGKGIKDISKDYFTLLSEKSFQNGCKKT